MLHTRIVKVETVEIITRVAMIAVKSEEPIESLVGQSERLEEVADTCAKIVRVDQDLDYELIPESPIAGNYIVDGELRI